jgi:hypothetical protein
MVDFFIADCKSIGYMADAIHVALRVIKALAKGFGKS